MILISKLLIYLMPRLTLFYRDQFFTMILVHRHCNKRSCPCKLTPTEILSISSMYVNNLRVRRPMISLLRAIHAKNCRFTIDLTYCYCSRFSCYVEFVDVNVGLVNFFPSIGVFLSLHTTLSHILRV